MILTSGATQKLQLVTTDATTTIDVEVAGVDFTSPSTFAPYSTQTAITGAATTDILAVRGASVYGNTEFISVTNTHATLPQTVRLLKVGTSITVALTYSITLAAKEWLIVNEEGTVFVYDVSGGVRMGQIAASDTAPGLIEIATQADQETATSTILAVTPGRQHFHPGHPKAWLSCGVAADIQQSYNITSLTDTGTGIVTVTIATDFAAATYAALVTVEKINTTLTEANERIGHIRNATRAVGSVAFDCNDTTTTTNLTKDPTTWHVAMFGDFA